MGWVRSFVARHYGITQVIVVVAAIEAYELLRHAMTPNWAIAERHAQDVVSWERSAHIAWEEGLQQTFLRLPDPVRAMNVFYFVGHFVLTRSSSSGSTTRTATPSAVSATAFSSRR